MKGKLFVISVLVSCGLLGGYAGNSFAQAQTSTPPPPPSSGSPAFNSPASNSPTPPVASPPSPAVVMAPSGSGPAIYQAAHAPSNPLNPNNNSLLNSSAPQVQGAENGVPAPPVPPTFQQQNSPSPSSPSQSPPVPQPSQVPYVLGSPSGSGFAVQPTALPPNAIPEPLPALPSPAQKDSFYHQQLFNNTAITPDQIRTLIKDLDARRRALATPPSTPSQPATGTIVVSLQPGSTPPIIRPYYGEVTSFSVVDNTGAPWPVANFRVGNAQLFSVNRLDGPQGSVFTVDALDNYGQSNLVLKLKGLDTPVVIGLIAGQPRYDSRVAVRIDRRGPNASVMQGTSLPPGVSSSLLSVADGVAPPSGKALTIEGDAGKTRGWLMPDHTMIVLTPLTIISPASRSFFSSGDGYNVYVFQAIPVLQGIYNHQEVTLSVTKGL